MLNRWQPDKLDPKHETLNPKPSMLNRWQHETLNPKPSMLNRWQPDKLDPKHETLNPKPSMLNRWQHDKLLEEEEEEVVVVVEGRQKPRDPRAQPGPRLYTLALEPNPKPQN
jgi:hypothetical protein